MVDDALGGVLDGNHSLGTLFSFHGVKDLANALFGHVARGGAESAAAGLVCERGLRPEVGDGQRLFQVSRGGEDFPKV